MRTSVILAIAGLLSAATAYAKATTDTRCIAASRAAATRCLRQYAEDVGTRRVGADDDESVAREVRQLVLDYLALNFFDGVLNGHAEALARLDPMVVGGIEEPRWQAR